MDTICHILGIGKNAWEWYRDINSHGERMQNLKRKRDDLSMQEEDINTELSNEERHPRKKRKAEVVNWLKHVQQMKDDVQRLEQEVGETRNVFSRAQLGKQVVEKIQMVDELQQKGRDFKGLVNDVLSHSGRVTPTTEYFVASTSAMNKDKVWHCLMNDKVRRIAVLGMGGVGKTTIMHHISNQLLKETCNFDDVIWATASKASDLIKLQSEIAKRLHLTLSDSDDEKSRAEELHDMLSRKKRYVLILDDMWDAFPLEKVGIPEPTISNGCKLVLTTRSQDVCRRMKCSIVKVELLAEQEALNLFMSKAFVHDVVLDPKVKKIATEIAKKCAGLPLAVITVAASLSGVTDIHIWRNSFNELSSLSKGDNNAEREVLEQLKFSYSRLNDQKLQDCFLYCALYPEDCNICKEKLIEYWIAEGLVAMMNSVEAMFDKGHAILGKLTGACLLESYGQYHVKMHDLIRDMALRITGSRFMVKAGEGLERIQYEGWSEDVERVSLLYNPIEELPSRPPNCPRLTTLLLGDNHHALRVIPDSFFMHMPRLKVLYLLRSLIECLPESISNLENLEALLVEDCVRLRSMPSLGKLKALKVLKLGESAIEEVPQGIEELVNLRNLDLDSCRSLETFPGLSRLSQLQCLRLDRTRIKVSAEELLCLRQLKLLTVRFHNAQELTSYMKSQQCQGLEKYFLVAGDLVATEVFDGFLNDTLGKEVRINFKSEPFGSGLDEVVLPSSIVSLYLGRCVDLISLSAIPSLGDATDLRSVDVDSCEGMKSICSSSSFVEGRQIPLRSVELLHLNNLPRFGVLFDWISPPHKISFNLRELIINFCASMKNIFPAELLQNFPNLEKLQVMGCDGVEEIIVEEVENSSSTITLPRLQKLNLFRLPILNSIYKGIMVCESLQEIQVYGCPMLRRLPLSLHMDNEQATAPLALRTIYGQTGWWNSLEWDDSRTESILQPLFLG